MTAALHPPRLHFGSRFDLYHVAVVLSQTELTLTKLHFRMNLSVFLSLFLL